MTASLLLAAALCGAAPTTVSMPGGEFMWPQFRGPGGEGHAAQTGLPTEWTDFDGTVKNIAWKAPIAGLGWSSPVINGDQVWITSGVEGPLPEQPAAAPPADPNAPAAKPEPVYAPVTLKALCYDRNSGKLLHDLDIFRIDNPGRIHKKNSHASPTPLLEGDRLYLHFGRHGTACITTAGEVVWKTQELVYEHRHGPGGSPVVYKDLLLISCDGTDVQFVVGLDKATGAVRWKSPREGRMAYTTPLLVDVDGTTQLISSGGDAVVAYEPETGKEIWRCAYDGYSLVPRPVVGHGMVYVCTGYDDPGLIAVRLGGSGDVTATHLAWEVKKTFMPRNASPLLVGDELYVVNDGGIASCLDAKTGETIWQERLGGNFSASPLLVDGRIYFLDEEGKTTVIRPGREFAVLAENEIDGRTLAGLSVAGKAFYLRTDTTLYRIEAP